MPEKSDTAKLHVPDFPDVAENESPIALLHAIDRQNLADTFIGPKTTVAHSYVGPDTPGYEEIEGTDLNAVAQGRISVTPIHFDLTDHGGLERLRGWGFEAMLAEARPRAARGQAR